MWGIPLTDRFGSLKRAFWAAEENWGVTKCSSLVLPVAWYLVAQTTIVSVVVGHQLITSSYEDCRPPSAVRTAPPFDRTVHRGIHELYLNNEPVVLDSDDFALFVPTQ